MLKSIGDAFPGAFCDGHLCNIFSVVVQGAGGHRVDAHDCFGKGGLAAAVGTGDAVKFPLFKGEIDAVENGPLCRGAPGTVVGHGKTDIF